MTPRVGVVVLNWNGWEDTLECLESVLRSESPLGPVVVCDNASDDGSLERIRAWAGGELDVLVPRGHPLRDLSHPPVPKPVPWAEHDRAAAERGGEAADREAPLVLVRNGGNLGFAGGNNVGLRYLLARGDVDYVWILNNDTAVRPDALRHLLEEVRRDPGIGVCGSTLLFHHAPGTVQTRGGASYNSWLALPRHIGSGAPAQEATDPEVVRARMAYVTGASMLVSARFLREVGLMSEDYFLYFEELDWAMRARGRFRLGYAPESVVYHKEGRSIGTRGQDRKSWTADYYFLRNRLRVTRRYFPGRLTTVRLGLLLALLRRVRRGQWDRVRLILGLWRSE